ncbi:unnamed protein product [Allacma fusca]|uniref:Uncharacterized protein n=1 Tax=Allacma fusca TaxID=39272 RepID=A0A8J2LGB0_9HEXA|nr:unnamed protein product [Allacma fusca]
MLYELNELVKLPPANPLITVFALVINFTSCIGISTFKLRWNERGNQYEVVGCSLVKKTLLLLIQITLCWKMCMDIKDATSSTRASGANILAFIALANNISLYSLSICQFYYNWVNRAAVISFVHELQHNYCLRKLSTTGRGGILSIYFLWKISLLVALLRYVTLLFGAPFWELKLILENSAAFVPLYFPSFVLNHAGLKFAGQIYVIFLQMYSIVFIFLADVIGVPVFTFSYLITKEFMLLIKAEGDNLTSKEVTVKFSWTLELGFKITFAYARTDLMKPVFFYAVFKTVREFQRSSADKERLPFLVDSYALHRLYHFLLPVISEIYRLIGINGTGCGHFYQIWFSAILL